MTPYVCEQHMAEWDALRQIFICRTCNHIWTIHDIPELLARIKALSDMLGLSTTENKP